MNSNRDEPGFPLFYESPVLLNKSLHADLVLTVGQPEYHFAAKANSVPVLINEVGQLAGHYPIVFVETVDDYAPVAILGIEAGQNLFVAKDGSWSDAPVPAYVRRYPYILAEEEGGQFKVCFDRHFSGLVDGAKGQPLFDSETHEPTDYLFQVIEFLQGYQAHSVETRAAMARLKEQGILTERVLEVATPSGVKRVLKDFFVVDENAVAELDDEVLAQWVRDGLMYLVHAHWFSLSRINDIADRYASRCSQHPVEGQGRES